MIVISTKSFYKNNHNKPITMKRQLLALSALVLLASCNQDEVADWKIRAKNEGLLARTYEVVYWQREGQAKVDMTKDPLGNDDMFQFGGAGNTLDNYGKAVRYQGEKLKWPTVPKITKFNYSMTDNGTPYATNMGGNYAQISVGLDTLIIVSIPVDPKQGFEVYTCHAVGDGVKMNGVTP